MNAKIFVVSTCLSMRLWCWEMDGGKHGMTSSVKAKDTQEATNLVGQAAAYTSTYPAAFPPKATQMRRRFQGLHLKRNLKCATKSSKDTPIVVAYTTGTR